MSGPLLKIVCWQPVLTDHQSETFAALANIEGVMLTAVTSRADNRDKPGWIARSGDVATELLPAVGWRRQIRELLADPDTVHVFASPFDFARVSVALMQALRLRRRVFLLSEPYSTAPVGYFADHQPLLARLKHRIRPTLYRLYGAVLAKRIAGVFAISPRGVRQYRRMGVAPERIFPFGYFVSPKTTMPRRPEAPPHRKMLRCVFVGSLIERKGFRLAIDAFASSELLQRHATLTIYGPGQLPTGPLPDGVVFGGALSNAETLGVMSNADLVLVPSLFDGWGVVVNEAILAGTPVIASDAVGAGAMVIEWQCGRLFRNGNSAALRDELEELVLAPLAVDEMRRATVPLSATLQPAVAGRFMYDCIRARLANQSAPAAPWYSIGGNDRAINSG